ncbi:MAG TPA: energy transducer TonB [Burkholderiales bacterium]|nr:energy transducer TonB [Burkholderiales bacterium]
MRSITRFLIFAGAAVALALGGCATTDQAQQTEVSASAPASKKKMRARRAANASAVAGYKQQVAKRIYARNPQTFKGKLPPLLKSVVVLRVTVDGNGKATKVSVRRSNGFKQLERVALDSVRKAGPLPRPSAEVLAGGDSFSYLETWLFREDGKFQIRSLAEAQMGAEGVVARR